MWLLGLENPAPLEKQLVLLTSVSSLKNPKQFYVYLFLEFT